MKVTAAQARRLILDAQGLTTDPARPATHAYVLPILEGERLIGRVDPRFDRANAAVLIEGLWWEPGVKPTKARLRAVDEALDRIRARQVGDASSA